MITLTARIEAYEKSRQRSNEMVQDYQKRISTYEDQIKQYKSIMTDQQQELNSFKEKRHISPKATKTANNEPSKDVRISDLNSENERLRTAFKNLKKQFSLREFQIVENDTKILKYEQMIEDYEGMLVEYRREKGQRSSFEKNVQRIFEFGNRKSKLMFVGYVALLILLLYVALRPSSCP